MKKVFSFALAAAVACALFAGCTTGGPAPSKNNNVEAEGALKTGLGVITSTKATAAADGAEGSFAPTFTAAAVVVDENGTIVDCKLDVLQASVAFGADGQITTDTAAAMPTKQERGDDYGMRGASGIGKEWYEQADAFCSYAVGKTVDQLAAGADETGAPTDADLTAGCTIGVSDFIKVVAAAAENATVRGAQEGDTLALALLPDASGSASATAEEAGTASVDVTFVAATQNAEGAFTSMFVDMTQTAATFDTTGAITDDGSADVRSKYEKKEDYHMKGASAIGKEWYEQADAFCSYAVGKTMDQLAAGADETGKGTDADLTAGCTINVSNLMQAAAKAAGAEA